MSLSLGHEIVTLAVEVDSCVSEKVGEVVCSVPELGVQATNSARNREESAMEIVSFLFI